MPEPPRARPFLVLRTAVVDFRYAADSEGEDWGSLECSTKTAFGCGAIGKHVVQGLSLMVRIGNDDDPNHFPILSIYAADEVFHRLEAEISDEDAEIWGRQLSLRCHLQVVEAGVMILGLYFITPNETPPYRSYYLVYDSASTSLSLVPMLRADCPVVGTGYPLPVRRGDGSYSLVLMATKPKRGKLPVVCMWSPTRRSSADACPWKKTRERQPCKGDAWMVDTAFSWHGKAIWADFAQGLLYCKCSDLFSGTGRVGFEFVLLPEEHRIAHEDARHMVPMHVYRCIGASGNYIWFVVILPSELDPPADTTVEVWTLDLLSEEAGKKKWKKHRVFSMEDIWEQDAFSKAKLPETKPMFPMVKQEDEGVLYMMLPTVRGRSIHLVGIDMNDVVTPLVSFRYLAIPYLGRPYFLPAPACFTTSCEQ